MITRAADIEDRKEIRRLTGGSQHRCRAAFQFRNFCRHRVIRRILKSGIKITVCLQIKELRHRLTGIIFKCRRLINRKNSRLPAFRAITRLYTACIDMSFLQNFLLFSFTFCYHLRPFSAS